MNEDISIEVEEEELELQGSPQCHLDFGEDSSTNSPIKPKSTTM